MPQTNGLQLGESVLTAAERVEVNTSLKTLNLNAKEKEEEELRKSEWMKYTASLRRKEEEIADIAVAAASLSSAPREVRVIPFPGFVIKTHNTVAAGHDNKVFINVFHHVSVRDDYCVLTFMPSEEYKPTVSMSLHTPSLARKFSKTGAVIVNNSNRNSRSNSVNSQALAQPRVLPSVHSTYVDEDKTGEEANNDALNKAGLASSSGVLSVSPLIYVSEPSSTYDKEGYVSQLYDVLISSSYFEKATVMGGDRLYITHPSSVNKVGGGLFCANFLFCDRKISSNK